MKVTILGCGSAAGVPSIANGWGRCDPANPKNRRRRASILVEEGETRILIDTSPDLREQLLDAKVSRLSAVLYTHGHADHIHGIDELREVNRVMQASIPAYGPAETLQALETRFAYAFQGIPEGQPVFRPWLVATEIFPGQAFTVGGVTVTPLAQDHGFSSTIGYRLNDVVYSTDLIDLPQASRDIVRGAKVLGWIADLKPHRAVITHMGQALDYDTLVSRMLPVGVTPAFDGMVMDV
jgi:phosphoribosyl 1,2-cyclic phosphate phosphodiesterase